MQSSVALSAAEVRLIAEIRRLSGWNGSINPNSDVIYDVGLNGWDLHELLVWINSEFGVDFSAMNVQQFPLDEPPPPLHSFFRRERKFKGLPVSQLLDAIAAKRWVGC